jgi:hypothetical protein
MIGVPAEKDRNLVEINLLSKTSLIDAKNLHQSPQFHSFSFAKENTIICKKQMVDSRSFWGSRNTLDVAFLFCLKNKKRQAFCTQQEVGGYRIPLP